jgi:hypothetical protein
MAAACPHSGSSGSHPDRHVDASHSKEQDRHVWQNTRPSSHLATAMTPATPLSAPERPLSATRLAQYSRYTGSGNATLRPALFPSEGQALMQRYGATPMALSPALAEAGSVFEHAAVAQLAAQAGVTGLRHWRAQELIDTVWG